MRLSYSKEDLWIVSGKDFILLYKGTESSGTSVPLASCLEGVLWCLLLQQLSYHETVNRTLSSQHAKAGGMKSKRSRVGYGISKCYT